jgi:hypothetical protein
MPTRRNFLAATMGLGVPAILTRNGRGADGPNERVGVGFIGTGNQGMGLLRRFLAADMGNVVGVCELVGHGVI